MTIVDDSEPEFKPLISRVYDVPHDQGGAVMVESSASPGDPDLSQIPYYSVWRGVPAISTAEASGQAVAAMTKDFAGSVTVMGLASQSDTLAWEWIENKPALRLPIYVAEIATLYDSTALTNADQNFLVVAHTTDPNVFYASAPEVGRSVDNLAPGAPQGLVATLQEQRTDLVWEESDAPDILRYLVYRSPDGTEATATQVGDTSEPEFSDDGRDLDRVVYYAVAGEDVHGNVGLLSAWQVAGVFTSDGEGERPATFACTRPTRTMR